MLKLSRISRSIITVIYVALMCVILFFSINAENVYRVKAWQVLLYMFLLVFSICFYQVLKRRLHDKIKHKGIIYIYRYVYLAVVLVVSRIIMVFNMKNTISFYVPGTDKSIAGKIIDGLINITGEQKYASIIINTVLVYLIAIIIKKIMLNIYENDAIATMSSLIYILSPVSLMLCLEHNTSIFNTLFIFIGILLIMKIYDHITQYGFKDNMYIYLSVILGAACVLDILFKGSIVSWILLAFSLTLFADYVDSTYVDVSKFEIVQKIFRLKKDEKLAIKKSFVVLGIITGFGIFALIITTITGLNNGLISIKDNIMENVYGMFGNVKLHYIISSIVIILFEVMAAFMNRKTNAKVSVIKIAVVIFALIAMVYTNTTYNLCTYDALLSISIILSIGNIYYNRNEKIKLLKEKN